MSDLNKSDRFCDFCMRTQHEVDKLIVGVRADICDACVDVCNGIIKEGSDFGTTAMWINRIKDKRKIKTF